MNNLTPNRRDVLKGIAAGGVSLTFAGTVSGEQGERFIVAAEGRNVRRRIERRGFTVVHEFADGTVYVVDGPEDERDELEETNGVEEVARDLRFELEEPEFEEPYEEDDGTGQGNGRPRGRGQSDHTETDLYEDFQWDKQVTEVLAAHDFATGAGTTLAILDTGIDPDHPDLEANVDENRSRLFSSGNPIDEDDNPWDNHGHGTHVAGTAAASHEAGAIGTGVIGTAPEATLVSAKVFWIEGFDEDDDPILVTTTADILEAISYAADIGADAANLSLGTAPLEPQLNAAGIRVAYERVIQDATRRGTVVVASAGNSDANLQQGGYFTVPNSTAGAVSISATGPNDLRTFYSNYGTNEIDVGAPGGGYETLEKTLETDEEVVEWPFPTNLVLSTVPVDVFGGYYAWFAGTSMAAPQVTGLVGLVRELDPHSTAGQVEDAIKKGAASVDGQSDADLGAGRVNAHNTVESLDD